MAKDDRKPRRRRPRKRGWARTIARVFGSASLLLALIATTAFFLFAGWLRSDHFQRWVGRQAETRLERLTCEQATLSRVQVSFVPPFVAIDGLHVWSEASDETIASVERIRIPFVLRNGGPAIGRLQLQRPVVQLHVGEDGKL
ncbi:MAG: hypothetical protein H0V89_00340, partial [Deltaproteobacteria bacterium]|nr:hypothetical protein [Deltaproteobacteria bacterium]